MKKSKLPLMGIALLMLVFALACNLIPEKFLPEGLKPNAEVKTLTTDEAKVEIRSANQELISMKESMTESPGISSLMYLSDLMGLNEDVDMKSAHFNQRMFKQRITYSSVYNLFRKQYALKSAPIDDEDDMMLGVLEYNFETQSFDLIEDSEDMLQIYYPADDMAMAGQSNNAILTISDYQYTEVRSTEEEYDYMSGEYVEVETTETVPVKAKISLSIDNAEKVSGDYQASYNADGLPLSLSSNLESPEYVIKLDYKSKGSGYEASGSMKENGEIVMEFEDLVVYNSDKTSASTIEGYLQSGPLKFNGTINAENIDTYTQSTDESGAEPDLDYMNQQIAVDVLLVDGSSKIGHLAYFMKYDSSYDSSSPELAIVYEDGTYDWLTDVLTFAEM